jgi:hypothetical protein
MGLEHSFFSEVGEEFSARYEFHDKVNEFAILIHAFQVNLNRWEFLL